VIFRCSKSLNTSFSYLLEIKMALGILRGLVSSQFENRNIGLGFLFVLLPIALLSMLPVIFGLSLDLPAVIFFAVRDIVYWILASVLMYLLLLAFKGQSASGRLPSVMSAYAVNSLIIFIAGLLMFLAFLIAVPSLFTTIASLEGIITPAELAVAISGIPIPSDAVLWTLLMFLLVLGIVTIFCGLYVIFKIGNLVRDSGRFSNWVFVVVFLGLSILLNYVLNEALGFVFSFWPK